MDLMEVYKRNKADNVNFEKLYITDCIMNSSDICADNYTISLMVSFVQMIISKSDEDISIGRVVDYVVAYWEKINEEELSPKEFIIEYGIDMFNGSYCNDDDYDDE